MRNARRWGGCRTAFHAHATFDSASAEMERLEKRKQQEQQLAA
ncbi:hypothetical protein [Sporosarcina sp. ACRSL]|nr:hypothetical protein [Sporosarcina sp. ACRSL]